MVYLSRFLSVAKVLQPHKGSSETIQITVLLNTWKVLQPHKGSSETHELVLRGRAVCGGFNPTRVRLKQLF